MCVCVCAAEPLAYEEMEPDFEEAPLRAAPTHKPTGPTLGIGATAAAGNIGMGVGEGSKEGLAQDRVAVRVAQAKGIKRP